MMCSVRNNGHSECRRFHPASIRLRGRRRHTTQHGWQHHCNGNRGRPLTASQRSLHNAPIFRLLLKVAVNGTHQCDFPNFCGQQCPTDNGFVGAELLAHDCGHVVYVDHIVHPCEHCHPFPTSDPNGFRSILPGAAMKSPHRYTCSNECTW